MAASSGVAANTAELARAAAPQAEKNDAHGGAQDSAVLSEPRFLGDTDGTMAHEAGEGLAPTVSAWVACETEDGATYYYNTETDESQWEMPGELLDGDEYSANVDQGAYTEEQHTSNGASRSTAPSYSDTGNATEAQQDGQGHEDWRGGGVVGADTPHTLQSQIAGNAEPPVDANKSLEIWNRFFENALMSQTPAANSVVSGTGSPTGDHQQSSTFPPPAEVHARNQLLFDAVMAGKLSDAEQLILSGTAASCVDEQMRTPLHYAAYNGDRDMAALLCDYTADIETRDSAGNTPLHVSAARGSTRTLVFLLEYAAMVDVQNDVGDTPLHLAAWFGNQDCVRHLLDYSSPVDMTNAYGLDAYHNVMARSPLAQKRKMPSELRRSLALIFDQMPSSPGSDGSRGQAAKRRERLQRAGWVEGGTSESETSDSAAEMPRGYVRGRPQTGLSRYSGPAVAHVAHGDSQGRDRSDGAAGDDFHDCSEDEHTTPSPPLGLGSSARLLPPPPLEVAHALHSRNSSQTTLSQSAANVQPPEDIVVALEMARRSRV
mmetsp:Transcript_31137/g.53667  ORF Transcript_31137/g.53667 Transcript_31137/m.53667 type:complete len:546 (+) Transcript_31137:1615-3252(+)